MIKDSTISSGGSPSDEYKRTIGAAFAFYWLMRLGIDGERGFCFGVDDNWQTNAPPGSGPPEGSFFALDPLQRRLAFYYKAPWQELNQLMADSGCLVRRASATTAGTSTPGGAAVAAVRKTRAGLSSALYAIRRPSAQLIGTPDKYWRHGHGTPTPKFRDSSSWEVDVERTVAMLVLTAIHDIMKVESLLPVVTAAHAPYRGFNAGDLINDHDVALAYVLESFGSALPSFALLPESQQRTICFTQAKIGFNHGWLVQAEAPPHALFSKFKEVILHERVRSQDVAFYFVHWLTDLAGAVPTPLQGSEKFVCQFPHFVLESFIHSFPVINDLAESNETRVFEAYLFQRWSELHGDLGPAPEGPDCIALMRLVVQAQGLVEQKAIVHAYKNQLGTEDRTILSKELCLTGIKGQTYQAGGVSEGPAFLVYYSPAFLRNVAKAEPLAALQILATVYRGARELWPCAYRGAMTLRRSSLDGSIDDGTVTVRIDQLKDMTLEKLREAHLDGDRWYICRRNDLEGVVVRHAAREAVAPADLNDSAGFRELDVIGCTDPNRPSGSAGNASFKHQQFV